MPTAQIAPEVSAFLREFFDKIYIISLRRATERQANFQQLLAGLSYDIFWAVDKAELDREAMIRDGLYDDVTVREPRYIHPGGLSEGELACALSHRAVYEEMVREGYQRVLVFEDDVVPRFDALGTLPEALRQLPADWELLYLGYTKNEVLTPKIRLKQRFYNLVSPLGLLRWSRQEASRYAPRPFSPNLRVAGLHDCTHAYAVSLAGAQKLVAAQTPIVASADSILSVEILNGRLRSFASVPVFFDQEGVSYINTL